VSTSEPLSVRQLEVFVALVDHGSFTRAAKHLKLSQSTVSGHIAELERRLGVRLVERDRGGARPTAAGKAFLRPARETLRAELNTRRAIADMTGLLSGVLVVGGSTIPSSYVLPVIFARFHAAYPGVSLRLSTGDSRVILDRVTTGEVEVGLVGERPRRSRLTAQVLGRDELILVASPQHELAGRRSVAMADVLSQPLVTREEGSGTRSAAEKALVAALGKRDLPELPIACEVGSTEAMKAAVAAGLGWAFISNLAVKEEMTVGSLVRIPLKGFSVVRSFHLVSRSDDLLSPAARAFKRIALKKVK
jgi:molybdate transport repressor ModE-like protein